GRAQGILGSPLPRLLDDGAVQEADGDLGLRLQGEPGNASPGGHPVARRLRAVPPGALRTWTLRRADLQGPRPGFDHRDGRPDRPGAVRHDGRAQPRPRGAGVHRRHGRRRVAAERLTYFGASISTTDTGPSTPNRFTVFA